jgi:hypothetical protein
VKHSLPDFETDRNSGPSCLPHECGNFIKEELVRPRLDIEPGKLLKVRLEW